MKTVFITGASSGIGKATALMFQKKGWNVAATMKEPEKETELNKLENVKCYRLDVTDFESIRKTVKSARLDFGDIDVLVNNAGIYTTKPLEMTSENDIFRIINTNIIGTLNVIKTVLPYFRNRKAGIIINVSSIAGKTTFPYQTVYHGTKWAIEGITEGLQYELKELNIRIKLVEPGMVKTNLYNSVKNISIDDIPFEYKRSFMNWHRYLLENFYNGYDPNIDAKTIYKAATDNKLKLRYVSDFKTKFVFILRALLPLSFFSFIVRKLCRI
jgi:NADP-dependent 3-hydroxy acid dehydrogenase YdfG